MYLEHPEPPLRPDEVSDGGPWIRRVIVLSAVLAGALLVYGLAQLAS